MLDKTMVQQNLIAMLGIEALPDEKKVDILEKTATLVEQRVVVRMLEMLGEEDRDALLAALADKEQEKIATLIAPVADKIEGLIQEEAAKVKEELQGIF